MENVINSYETLFVADLSNGEDAAKATAEKFTSLIGSNGEIVEVDTWGKRRLAYLINDMSEGYYTVVTYKSAPSFIAELERQFNIDESIMRSLTVKLDFEPVAKSTVEPEATEDAASDEASDATPAEELSEAAPAEAADAE